MIDWIKAMVGINLGVTTIMFQIFWWYMFIKEGKKKEYTTDPAPKKRTWMYATLTFVFILWMFLLPMYSFFYRHLVVTYARMTYSDSVTLCAELKDYGYICREENIKHP